MLTSLLFILVILGLIYGGKRWQTMPEKQRKDFGKKIVIYGGIAVVLALVVSGRAHWLMGVLAALLGLAARAVQLAEYAPMFKRFLGEEAATETVARAGSMSRREAADILGVDINASPDEVRQAHKKLMQKIHPDRGGSDGLAKQLNAAKDVLIG